MGNRVSLLHLLVGLLSQPLFHGPEEYLVILNPFATLLTSRKCKNVKSLFISLLNIVLAYDTRGYVSYLYSLILSYHLCILGYPICKRNRHTRRARNLNYFVTSHAPNLDRIQ